MEDNKSVWVVTINYKYYDSSIVHIFDSFEKVCAYIYPMIDQMFNDFDRTTLMATYSCDSWESCRALFMDDGYFSTDMDNDEWYEWKEVKLE